MGIFKQTAKIIKDEKANLQRTATHSFVFGFFRSFGSDTYKFVKNNIAMAIFIYILVLPFVGPYYVGEALHTKDRGIFFKFILIPITLLFSFVFLSGFFAILTFNGFIASILGACSSFSIFLLGKNNGQKEKDIRVQFHEEENRKAELNGQFATKHNLMFLGNGTIVDANEQKTLRVIDENDIMITLMVVGSRNRRAYIYCENGVFISYSGI